MHEHGPDELIGPVRGSTAWWQGMGAQPALELEDDGPPVQTKTARKRSKTNKVSPSIRTELVERIRKEIADGTYDTEEKWEAALEKLLERLDPGADER